MGRDEWGVKVQGWMGVKVQEWMGRQNGLGDRKHCSGMC